MSKHKQPGGIWTAQYAHCAVDREDPSHILSCLPTGYGKSIPMLLLSLFLPPGMTYDIYREGLTEMLSQKD